MCKMKISVKYAENFLIFDLLLNNGFKIQNITKYCVPFSIIYRHGQIKNKRLELLGNLNIFLTNDL